MNNNEMNNNLNNNIPNANTDNYTSVPNNVNVTEESPIVDQTKEVESVQTVETPTVQTVDTVQQPVVNEPQTVPVQPVTPVVVPQSIQQPVVNEPQVQVPVNEVNKEQTETLKNNNSNTTNDDEKINKKRLILLALLFIVFLFFILFLPNISEFFRNGRGINQDAEVNTGKLVCNMEKEEDTRTTSYEYTFNFTNKKIVISSYNTTLESESKADIKQNSKECEMIKKVADEITGIDITCTSSDNISTTIQNNNLKVIDTSKLTKFTEAGGMYPEFKYNENPYDVKSRLVKVGYDCTITAK